MIGNLIIRKIYRDSVFIKIGKSLTLVYFLLFFAKQVSA